MHHAKMKCKEHSGKTCPETHENNMTKTEKSFTSHQLQEIHTNKSENFFHTSVDKIFENVQVGFSNIAQILRVR